MVCENDLNDKDFEGLRRVEAYITEGADLTVTVATNKGIWFDSDAL